MTSASKVIAFGIIPLIVASAVAGIYLSSTLGQVTSTVTYRNESLDYSAFNDTASVTNSSLGLELITAVNSTHMQNGRAIGISISLRNVLPRPLNVTSESDWALPAFLHFFPCPRPMSVAIFEGYYGTSNLSSASFLPLWPPREAISCPALFTGTYQIEFPFANNSNQNVSVMYGQSTPYYGPLQESVTENGYYSKTLQTPSGPNGSVDMQPVFVPFAPGIYTIAAGDEWGQVAILHFVVLAQSTEISTENSGSSSFSTSTTSRGMSTTTYFSSSVQITTSQSSSYASSTIILDASNGSSVCHSLTAGQEGSNATWDSAVNVCTITGATKTGPTFLLSPHASLIISSGVMLFLESRGFGFANYGFIENDGQFVINNSFVNYGAILNAGEMDANGTFLNTPDTNFMADGGFVNNTGAFLVLGNYRTAPNGTRVLEGGSLTNENQFFNSGRLYINQGILENQGLVPSNASNLINTGQIQNIRGQISNSGLLSNYGTILNNGTFVNSGQFMEMCNGSFINNGSFSGSQPVPSCSATSSMTTFTVYATADKEKNSST